MVQILRMLSSQKQRGQSLTEGVVTKQIYTKQAMKSIRNVQRMRGALDSFPVELICYGMIVH